MIYCGQIAGDRPPGRNPGFKRRGEPDRQVVGHLDRLSKRL